MLVGGILMVMPVRMVGPLGVTVLVGVEDDFEPPAESGRRKSG